MSADEHTNDDLRVLRTASLLIIAAVALTAALVFTRAAMVPLVFSLILYALITETTDWFAAKLRWPRWLSLGIVFLTFIGLVCGFGWLATVSIDTFVQGISQYQLRVQEFLLWLSRRALYFGYSFNVDKWTESVAALPILDWATTITGFVLEFVGNFALVLIFLIFLLLGEQKGRARHPVVLEVRNKISSFVAVKTIGSCVIAIAIAILLAALDIEMVVLFAAITFAANYIPQVGSLISALLPVPVIMLRHGAGVELLVFIVLSILLQFLSGNFIETKLMGERLDLHPVTILVFLIFWGLVWGVAGMFVAVPITFVLKWGLSRHSLTRPCAEILAGRLPQA
ncbi:MAG TPA: AI-2E family transporter [Bdellovibrionota bacterium]|nr:AI-2E family transporter [Bdellovibrionota bacterium]